MKLFQPKLVLKMKKTFALLFLALLVASALQAQSKKQKRKRDKDKIENKYGLHLENSEVFSKSFTGFALFDAEQQQMLYEYNADKYFTPASNTKILTFYTCLRTLGDSIPALRYQRQGDLMVFWGTGDPSFLNPHLQQNSLVFDFLKNIKEQLYFSAANFRDQRYGDGWMWGDYSYSYQAEKSPFPVYSNVAHFRLNDTTRNVEVQPPFLKNYLRQDTAQRYGDYIGRVEFDNQFTLNSSIPNGRDTEWHVPYRYTPGFVAEILTDTLKRPVHVIEGKLMPPADAGLIYSLAADSLYRLMMQESDNFIAEQLLLVCSGLKFGSMNSAKMIDFSLTNYLDDLPDKPQWVDGSGLSRYNLFTPRTLVALLNKIYQTVPRSRLFNIFPAGGVSGTLQYNYRNGNAPYVFAKTGTLRNNHCLSGYLLTKKGKLLIFSFMHNNFMSGASAMRKEMEKVLRGVYEEN